MNFRFTASRAPAAPRSRPAGVGGASAAQLEELNAQVLEKNLTIEGLEKERDFYFGKLRNVELMLQVQQDKNFEGSDLDGIVENIFKVLYATADEDVNLDDDGEVMPPEDLNTTEASAVSIPAQESEVY